MRRNVHPAPPSKTTTTATTGTGKNKNNNFNNNNPNKKKNRQFALPDESHLSLLPAHPSAPSTPIVDTHTHLLSTFSVYKSKYPTGRYETVWDFVRGVYGGRNVGAIVDVWCEAPVRRVWKEIADSAVSAQDRAERWGGIEYWFVLGVHPHEAKLYDDAVEKSIIEAMAHPRCVGWGEIGLDYHYENSPRDVQQRVFARQLRAAVQLQKPLTIHTREAEADTERILKQHVPVDHKIHVHCFTDSPEFAKRLLDHFPNVYFGITGVVSYATNRNTSALLRQMAAEKTTATTITVNPDPESNDSEPGKRPEGPRILLETDAPYMVPSNVYASLPGLGGARLPLCHTAMIPWVADFVVGVVQGGLGRDAADVMQLANRNARWVYGV